ncbi:hypothetical protein SMICM17S_06889 [Streptomyces microflavus]
MTGTSGARNDASGAPSATPGATDPTATPAASGTPGGAAAPLHLAVARSSWEAEGRRKRRCYALTEAGARFLADERTAWQDFTAAIGSVLNPVAPHPHGQGA